MIEISPPQPLHMGTAERASGGQGGVTEPVAALPQAGLPGSLLEAGAERALDGGTASYEMSIASWTGSCLCARGCVRHR